jgi:hypothetical protein
VPLLGRSPQEESSEAQDSGDDQAQESRGASSRR